MAIDNQHRSSAREKIGKLHTLILEARNFADLDTLGDGAFNVGLFDLITQIESHATYLRKKLERGLGVTAKES